MTTQQLVDELKAHFSELSRKSLLARGVNTMSNLPVLRTSKNIVSHLARRKKRVVYICRVSVNVRDER